MRDLHDLHHTNRRTTFAPLAALLAVLALPGCGTLFGSGDGDESAPAKLQAFEPLTTIEKLWSRRAASGEGGQRLKLLPALAGGQVVAAGHDGDVAAYDPSTGERRWETETGIPISAGPGAGFGLVAVGSSGGDVVALASESGAVAWRARVTSEVLSAPAVGERIVAVRTIDGKLFGLDAANGERRWVYDRTVPALTLRGTSAPVIIGDVVLAGFDSGHLAALSIADGSLSWEFHVAVPTGSTELERLTDMDADPVVSDGVVYAVTFQGRIAALDLRTGQLLWERDMSSHAGIGIGRRLLYVTDDRSHVWALDRNTGASLWRQAGLELRQATRPVEFRDHVAVADFEGQVHWLRIDDGRFAARTRVGGGPVLAPPTASQAALYVLGESGTLTALTIP